MRRLKPAVFLLLALALVGCSKKYKIYIESDTSWTGTIDKDLVIFGELNQTFEVKGALTEATASKRTDIGYLRLRIDDRRPAETTDPFGTVTVRN